MTIMADGVNAVKAALVRDFGAVTINEGFDVTTKEIILDFTADAGLDYRVRVSREFDDDYASGQIGISLEGIGDALRSSHNGRLRITSGLSQ
jgi:hypothetical protein